MRHMIVAVLTVVVINAQLTWWIVFVLRLNRNFLDLERELLLGTAKVEAVAVATELETARTALRAALLMGDEPGLAAVPAPFVGWRTKHLAKECPAASINQSGVIELSVENGISCVTGVMAGDSIQRVLDVGDGLEVITSGGVGPPGIVLSEPFSGLTVSPRSDAWDGILQDYRRRIVMMVSEGGFFAVLLMVLVGLMWQTFRREVELERQHRNFLSAVTHELKSPLASMRLALETVIGGRAEPEAANRFLGNALEDTDRLQDLVQKVLEATRFGESRAEIVLKDSDLSGLVEDAVGIFRRRALAAGAHLEVQIEPEIRSEIDPEALAIVISNLLENAVKYGGEPPQIDLRFGLQGRNAVLEVSDNGKGIPEADLSLIFGRFFRSGDEMTRTTHGTGLGLYLVQQIVEAHRGSVEVAETGPEGTTFKVAIPGREV